MTKTSLLLGVLVFVGLISSVYAVQSNPNPRRNRQEKSFLVPRRTFYPLSTLSWNMDVDRSLRMVDALIEQAWRGVHEFENFASEIGNKRMPMEILEDESGYHIRAELPGIPKNHIAINLKEDVLTISAEWSDEKSYQKDTSPVEDIDDQRESEQYPEELKKEEGKSVVEKKEDAKELLAANRRGTTRSFSQMSRTIKLPSWADLDHITAKYENGVLEVFVPMLEAHEIEDEMGRNIDINPNEK